MIQESRIHTHPKFKPPTEPPTSTALFLNVGELIAAPDNPIPNPPPKCLWHQPQLSLLSDDSVIVGHIRAYGTYL